MAWVSNGRDVTELMRAIQEYSRSSVIEAKTPRKDKIALAAQAKRTEQAWRLIEVEIDKLTADYAAEEKEVDEWIMGKAEGETTEARLMQLMLQLERRIKVLEGTK